MGGLSIQGGFNSVAGRINDPLKTTKKELEEKKGGSHQKNNDLPSGVVDYSAGLPLSTYPYGPKIEKIYDTPVKIDKAALDKQKKVGLYDLPMGNNASDLKTELKRNYQANADRLNKSPYTAKEKAEALASLCPKNRDKALFVLIYLRNRNPKLFADIMGELKKQLSDKDYSWLKDSMAKISITRSGQLIDPATNKEIDFLSYMGTDAQSKREEMSIIQQGVSELMMNNFDIGSQNSFGKEFVALKELGSKLNKIHNISNDKAGNVKPSANSSAESVVSDKTAESKERGLVEQIIQKEMTRIFNEIEKKAKDIFLKTDKETLAVRKEELKKIINELLSILVKEEKQLQIKLESGKLDSESLQSGKNLKKRLNEIAEFVKERYRQVFPS